MLLTRILALGILTWLDQTEGRFVMESFPNCEICFFDKEKHGRT